MVKTIIDRYFLKEIFPPFLISLAVLTGMLFLQQFMEFIELSLNKGADFQSLLKISLYASPSILVMTLPISVLIGSITAMNRLSSDNEVISLRAAGVNFYRMERPFLIFATGIGILSLILASYAKPGGGNLLKEISMEILKKNINIALEEGTFNELLDARMMIFVEEMPTYTDLKGILISDLRNPEEPSLILAENGVFVSDESSSTIGFQLRHGNIYKKGKTGDSFQQLIFEKYDLKIDLSAYFKPTEGIKEKLGIQSLREKIAKTAKNKVALEDLQKLQEYYKTYALPFTTFLFGLVGPPLGTYARRSAGQLGGFAVAIGIAVFYYFLTVAGDFLLGQNLVSPFASAFLPNMILLFFSIPLLLKTDRQGFRFFRKKPA